MWSVRGSLCSLSAVCRKNLGLYNFFSYFQLGVFYLQFSSWLNFILFDFILISSIDACLSHTSTVTLCDRYIKEVGFPPTSTCRLLRPFPAVDSPLSHLTITLRHTSHTDNSKNLKFSQKQIHFCTWFAINPLSDLICPVCHCLGFAVCNDTFSTIQNIYLTFPLFSLSA